MTTWCLGFGINDNLIFRFRNKWQLVIYVLDWMTTSIVGFGCCVTYVSEQMTTKV